MNNYKKFLSAFAIVLMSLPLFAQTNCDPWITSIYKQLYNRQPNSNECNIRNYNNGSWSNYEQLTGYVKKYQSNLNIAKPVVSGDPWIMAIYKSLYNRLPNSFELNVLNYNNGKWSSYNQLTGYIRQYQTSLRRDNITVETAVVDENMNLVAIKKNEEYMGVLLLSNSNGQVIASGGAEVIAAGGGNVVAAGGGNVVAAGGGNVIAAGGGNVIAAGGGNVVASGGLNYRVSSTGGVKFFVSKEMGGVRFGNQYSVQSGVKLQVKTSGTGSLIFK